MFAAGCHEPGVLRHQHLPAGIDGALVDHQHPEFVAHVQHVWRRRQEWNRSTLQLAAGSSAPCGSPPLGWTSSPFFGVGRTLAAEVAADAVEAEMDAREIGLSEPETRVAPLDAGRPPLPSRSSRRRLYSDGWSGCQSVTWPAGTEPRGSTSLSRTRVVRPRLPGRPGSVPRTAVAGRSHRGGHALSHAHC